MYVCEGACDGRACACVCVRVPACACVFVYVGEWLSLWLGLYLRDRNSTPWASGGVAREIAPGFYE